MTKRARSAGYTLPELMIVVVIMAVLATVAVYGVRQYIKAARTAEAYTTIASIQSAQEAYRDEAFRYLDVSSAIGNYCPAAPSTVLRNWDAVASPCTAAIMSNWATLGVRPTGMVRFGYSSTAGTTGQTPSAGTDAPDFGWTVSGPWYVIKAVGDQDGDSEYSIFVASSFTSSVWNNTRFE